jgi:hypothetical protein
MKNVKSTIKPKTTRDNLEERFEAGESVLDYFDTSKPQWGGARSNAGRKVSGRVQYVTRLSPALIKRVKRMAAHTGQSECAIVEAALQAGLHSNG